jgi:hypothetical protein
MTAHSIVMALSSCTASSSLSVPSRFKARSNLMAPFTNPGSLAVSGTLTWE